MARLQGAFRRERHAEFQSHVVIFCTQDILKVQQVIETTHLMKGSFSPFIWQIPGRGNQPTFPGSCWIWFWQKSVNHGRHVTKTACANFWSIWIPVWILSLHKLYGASSLKDGEFDGIGRPCWARIQWQKFDLMQRTPVKRCASEMCHEVAQWHTCNSVTSTTTTSTCWQDLKGLNRLYDKFQSLDYGRCEAGVEPLLVNLCNKILQDIKRWSWWVGWKAT